MAKAAVERLCLSRRILKCLTKIKSNNIGPYQILSSIFPRKKITLSLLIKMAHNLHIGQKFEDFAAFESAIMRYQNAENVQFYRRDSSSVDKAQPRLEKKLNPKIKYNEGAREGRYAVYQTVTVLLVRFRYHKLNSSALTSLRFNSLHCYIFFGVPHFFNFVFSLVLNN